MSTLNLPSVAALKRAIVLAEKIESLQAKLAKLRGSEVSGSVAKSSPSVGKSSPSPVKGKRGPKKGGMSEEGRARIAAAQKARWAKARKAKK